MDEVSERVEALAEVLRGASSRGASRADLDRALLELIRETASSFGEDALGPRALGMLEWLPRAESTVDPTLWGRLTEAMRAVASRGGNRPERSTLEKWCGHVASAAVAREPKSHDGRSPLALLIQEKTRWRSP